MADEEDQLAKEREEERLRLEREREIAIAKYKRYIDNKKLRSNQIKNTEAAWNEVLLFMNKYRNSFREQLLWDNYLYEPNRLNCLSIREINTFISLWDKRMRSLKAVDEQIGVALELIADIYYTEYLFPEIALDIKKNWCNQIKKIEDMIEEVLCLSTFKVLKYASNILDIKTGNLQYQNIQPHSALCLWWNVSKNPKYKYFDFHLAGITFKLAAPMVGLDFIIQFRRTSFDNFSHYCHSFMTKTYPYCLEPEVFENPSLKPILLSEEVVEAKAETTGTELEHDPDEEIDQEPEPEEDIVYPPREPAPCPLVAFSGIEDTCEMSLILDAVEEIELIPGEINLREMIVLGGIWYVNLLMIPPQPIKIEKWRLIEDIPNDLKTFPYEFSYKPPRSSITFAEDDPEAEIEDAKQKLELDKLMVVEIKLDTEKIVWMDAQRAPTLARWDNSHHCWTTKDIYEVKYDEDVTTITCRLGVFAPLVILQSKFIAFPYQSWLLQPLENNIVRLMIQTSLVSIEIHIMDEKCALIQAIYNEQLCLEYLYNEFMFPKLLLRKMRSYGVNFFPEHDSHKYIEPRVKIKDWILEKDTYKNLALCCAGFEFGSSRWNVTVGNRKAVFKIREQITPKIKGPQYLVLCSLHDTYVLQSMEQSQDFTDTPMPDQEFHTDLYHLVLIAGSSEAKELVKDCSFQLIDGVYNTLSCIKPLSHCQ